MLLTGAELRQLNWRKARRSIGNGDCVEVASVDGWVAVRDSKNPDGPVLTYTAAQWRLFLGRCEGAEFGGVMYSCTEALNS
jgi:hypothetical protein